MKFEICTQLLLEYSQRVKTAAAFDHHVAYELLCRIRQLSWLYEQIELLERQYWSEVEKQRGPRPAGTNWVNVSFASNVPAVVKPGLDLDEQLRLLVESFYYIAHRIVVILRQTLDRLPGLKEVPAESIRRIRNNLIEHSNKSGGRIMYSFSISNVAGVRLKSAMKPEDPDTIHDEGIHANAEQFRAELESMLRSARDAV